VIPHLFLFFSTWLLQAGIPAPEASKPLPSLEPFLQGIRDHLHSDRILLSHYTYLERSTVRYLEGNGKVQKTEERVFEVYPSLEEHLTYRTLISKNGKPLSAEETTKQNQANNKKIEERQRKLEREGADEKRRREAKEAEEKRKEKEVLDEAFRLYAITMTGREQIEGQPAIALAFQPRAGYRTKTREGKVFSKMRGKAWFSEADQMLIRIDLELLDDYSIGLGLVAKLNRGTRMVFQRRRVNNEIWLPSESHFKGTGRILLFKGLNIDAETAYSDYKKFSVETSVTYDTPKKP
jgi:hypothetical protein